jgi:alpha-ketoglutarate-dependent taurine dioxygenase
MAYETVTLTPRIGTEVRADLATLLGGEHARELKALLVERGVLVFRGHQVTPEQQIRLAATFGTPREEHGQLITMITPDPVQSPIFADYTKGTYWFHIDGTYTDTPGFATLLHAKALAPEGGQTEFCNTYALYDDLPAEVQRKLDGLDVMHSGEHIQRLAFPEPTEAQLDAWGERRVPPRQHPLVWQHDSGRKSLLTAYSCKYVVGMDQAESGELLAGLLQKAEEPQYRYCHDWQVGDLLIWDNTGTMHRVIPFDLASGRLLHRVTLFGEEKITAPERLPA